MPPRDYLRSAPFRIASRYAALFAVSVLILFAVIFWATTREMTEQLRGSIEADMALLLEVHQKEGLQGVVEDVRERIGSVSSDEISILLEDDKGILVAGNVPAIAPFDGWRELPAGRTAGESQGNVLSHGMRLNDGFLMVGRSTYGISEIQKVLRRSIAWTLGLTVPLALLGGIIMGHSALRRLEAINLTAQEIVGGNLSRRVPVTGTGDELDRLALTMNRMLDRIEELMNGLRQVTSDIAHDLRTPLGRMRQRLEVARTGRQSVEAYQQALDRAVEDTDGILDTFNALLRIAQIETGARKARFTRVAISEVAATIVEAYQTVAEDNGQALSASIAEGITVHGDRDLLTQLLANLVENAVCHTPAGTAITVAVDATAGAVLVSVADTGPGIPAAERKAVLGRFYRLEGSRTTPGSGLGLALVRAVADLHEASLALTDNRPGLRVTVSFPAAGAGRAPGPS
jgi:signal transduction histidine kinase